MQVLKSDYNPRLDSGHLYRSVCETASTTEPITRVEYVFAPAFGVFLSVDRLEPAFCPLKADCLSAPAIHLAEAVARVRGGTIKRWGVEQTTHSICPISVEIAG